MRSYPESETFCFYPFYHIATATDGHYKLCCEADPSPHTVKDMSIKEWWNSSYINEVRDKMLNGERISACQTCYHLEDQNIESKRLRPQAEVPNYGVNLRKPEAYTLDLRPGNACNLRCLPCNPRASSRIQQERAQLEKKGELPSFLSTFNQKVDWDDPIVWEDLNEFAPQLRSVYLAGGEPSLNPRCSALISKLQNDCRIRITTNLAKYNENFFSALEKFDDVAITVSCDGIGEAFNILRNPGNSELFWQNLVRLRTDLPKAQIILNYVFYSLSAFQLIPIMDKISQFNQEYGALDFNLVPLTGPGFLHVKYLKDEEIERLRFSIQEYLEFSTAKVAREREYINILQNAIKLINEPKSEAERSFKRQVLSRYIFVLTKSRDWTFQHLEETLGIQLDPLRKFEIGEGYDAQPIMKARQF